MRNKTRILVTHELSYLKYADLILIIGEGSIISEGSYTELMQSGALAKLVEECKTEAEMGMENNKDNNEAEEYISDDSDEIFIDDKGENLLGSSALSTVSGWLILNFKFVF